LLYRLYWYPNDLDFSTARGWPSNWTNHLPYTQALMQRLPATDNPSPDGVRTLEQTFTIMQQMLTPGGFQNITLNNNPNFRDPVFGYSPYNVSSYLLLIPILPKPGTNLCDFHFTSSNKVNAGVPSQHTSKPPPHAPTSK